MNPINGRKPTSVATQIKNYANEALRRRNEGAHGKDGVVHFINISFNSSLGEVKVTLIAQNPFQNSNYRVDHPTHGKFMGYLNGNPRNGEYGHTPGKPTDL